MRSGAARSMTALVMLGAMTGQMQAQALPNDWEQSLLATRESVWRAWFAGDQSLAAALPDEFVGISSGGGEWQTKDKTLAASRRFAEDGGKLEELRFPVNRIQRYGNVAIIYSEYQAVLVKKEDRSVLAGRVTEVFVWDGGRWRHPGWHLDSGK
jgi:hypothetical protein